MTVSMFPIPVAEIVVWRKWIRVESKVDEQPFMRLETHFVVTTCTRCCMYSTFGNVQYLWGMEMLRRLQLACDLLSHVTKTRFPVLH